jgi:hypothetical protein
MKLVGALAFIFLLLLALTVVASSLKEEVDKENAANPHSDDVPWPVWLLVPAVTIGLTVWTHIDFTPPSDGTPEGFVLTFVAAGAFVLSLLLVLVVSMVIKVIQYGIPKLTYQSEPQAVPDTPTERIGSYIVVALMIGYGAYGLWMNDLYIPGRNTEGMHFHGIWAVTVFAGTLVMLGSILLLRRLKGNDPNARWPFIGIFVGLVIMFLAMFGQDADKW